MAWPQHLPSVASPMNIWSTVRESALRRLGKPLLVAYLVLFLVALVIVAGAVFFALLGGF